LPSANARQAASLSSILGLGSSEGFAGAHGGVIDDVAVLDSDLPSTAMQVFRLMNTNLSRVKLLQKAKVYQQVRGDHVAICLHDVTQLDLERREIMISQLVGKAFSIVFYSFCVIAR
jgi:hypothetical protein